MEEQSRTLDQLSGLLKRKYLETPHIERLFYPDDPLSLDECYLHLALIEEKEIKKAKEKTNQQGISNDQSKSKEENTQPREHFLREYERIEHIERKLDIKDLLLECKQIPKRIYIEGAAGVGKSTLSRYIVHQWSLNQQPWKQYKLVFHVRLRELTENNYTEKNTELLKVFERECFGLGHGTDFKKEERESLEKAMRQNPTQVLLVLDGVDELQLTTNYVREIWQSLINSHYDLIFTSRPGAQSIKRDLRINLNLGVLGFSDEQIEKYINNFFNTTNTSNVKAEDAQNCLAILKNNANLWSLAHTPIQLELLCSIWGEELRQQELNLTDLYRLMLEKLLKRYEQLQLKQQGQIVNLDEIDIGPLKEKYQHQLHYMEYLAFQGMQGKIIVLSEKHINESYDRLPKNTVKAVEFYRQLKGLGLLKRYDNGNKAEFAHLTFQEFFAAKYIARAIKAFCEGKVEGLSHEALFDFIKQTKWDLFYEVMWWFVAGLLAGKRNQNHGQQLERYRYQANENIDIALPKSHIRKQRLQAFFDLLLQEPRNVIRYEELLLVGRCLDEASMPEIIQKEAIVKHLFYYYSYYIDTNRYVLIPQFARIGSLIRLNPIFVKLNSELFEEYLLTKLNKIIYHSTGDSSLDCEYFTDLLKVFPDKVLPILLDGLKDKNDNVRSHAISALGNIGTQAPKKIIPLLLEAFKDKEECLHVTVIYALGKVGKNAPQIVVPPLIEAFKVEPEWIQHHLHEVLKRLLYQAPGYLIPALLETLKDQDPIMRSAAAKALRNIGKQAAENVISALLEALKDQNADVRGAAADALGDFDNQTEEKVISSFLEAFKDKLRIVAAYSLGNYGYPASERVISALLAALKDHNDSVRWHVVQALKRLITQSSGKLISQLVEALKDQAPLVREQVIYALGKHGTPAIEKVIPALLEVCKDQHPHDDIVWKAIPEALGELGTKSPEIVIPVLVKALKDQNATMRCVAIKVLGKVGIQTTEKVIPELLEVLKDKNDYVRRAAAESLGNVGTQAADKVIPALLDGLKDKNDDVLRAAAESLGNVGTQAADKVIPALLEVLKDKDRNVRSEAAEALGKVGTQFSENVIPALRKELENRCEYQNIGLQIAVVNALGKLGMQSPEKVIPILVSLLHGKFDGYREYIIYLAIQQYLGKISSAFPNLVSDCVLKHLRNNDYMPQEIKRRQTIIISILSAIKIISPTLLDFSTNELFPKQPPSIPPSHLICSPKDIVKVDNEGKLLTLTLCGLEMASIIRNNQEPHVINEDFWTISIVRKREGVRYDNASPGFFKSIKFTNGLFDHAFIIIEGVKQNVRYAIKIDLYAEQNGSSQSSGQKIRIEVTEINDFKRLEKLAENCSCMVHGISRQKVEQLEEIIKKDQTAAEQGEIIYNIKGDGSFSNSNRDKKEHSCISWCLEKWQEIGLPLQRKWYDAIVVVPKAYLPEPESQSEKCSTM